MLWTTFAKSLAVSLLCAAFSVAAAELTSAQPSGNCAAASTTSPAASDSAVNLPQYSAAAGDSSDADDAAEQQAAAAQTEWANYLTSVVDASARSGDPRDWAFAAISNPLHLPAERERTDALLARAVKAAPDDVLVQWIAARVAQERDAPDATAAAARVQHLEPDNAAAFIDELSVATHSNDPAAIDKTLATMSTAARFDLHYADLLKGLVTTYSRAPRPALATDQDQGSAIAAESLPYIDAMASMAVVAFPPFQHLVNACRVRFGNVSQRSADCAAVGRLLVHSDTMLGNRIGYAILRVSHTYTADDEASARDDDWVYSNYLKLARDESGASQILQYHKAWLDSASELEVVRRLLDARGVAPAPPDDWTDDTSPFSAQRLAADAEWNDRHASVK